MNRKNTFIALFSGVTAVAAMILIERLLTPSYCVKSLLKLLIFSGAVLSYKVITGIPLRDILHITGRKPSRKLLFFMIGTYVFIMAGFFLLRNQLDLTVIRNSLFAKEHLTRENFWAAFLYIILVNSFLEEAFFRGFLYHALKPLGTVPAYLTGSLLFAVYHLGIVTGWFRPLITVLCIAGLMGAGIFLQYIEERNGTLLASWTVHAFANLAINSIGTIVILAAL